MSACNVGETKGPLRSSALQEALNGSAHTGRRAFTFGGDNHASADEILRVFRWNREDFVGSYISD
jgi:hypothetical protein